MLTQPISTRGASSNPVNRFEKIHLEPDENWNPEENPPAPVAFKAVSIVLTVLTFGIGLILRYIVFKDWQPANR